MYLYAIGKIDKKKINSPYILDRKTIFYKSAELRDYYDYEGKRASELYIGFTADCSLTGQVIIQNYPFFVSLKEGNGLLRLPVVTGILKHYFENYKDYYYFPEEDMAIHKSLAVYAESTFKVKANVSNACVKKTGSFLPQYEGKYPPVFKTVHNSETEYFELTDKFLSSAGKMQEYLLHILSRQLTFS